MLTKIHTFIDKYNVPLKPGYEELIFKFSLMLLVLDGSTGWNAQILMRITCTLMLVFGKYAGNKLFWGIIISVLLLSNSLQWYMLDNHKILFMYWVLLLTMYLWLEKDTEYIRANSKLLIGLVMLFAVVQKVLNEFLTPGFLHGRFLFDSRFMLITHFLTDIPVELLYKSKQSMTMLNALPIHQSFVQLKSTPLMATSIYIFQVFGLVVEFLVSILFLGGKKDSNAKDISLIIFCIGTYFIFPVIGFSSILLLLGIAQSTAKIRPYYIIAFIVLQFIKVPWQELLYYIENASF